MQLLHDLRATNSRLDKEGILTRATDLDKRVFEFAYNPDKMFYNRFDDIDWSTVNGVIDAEMFGILIALYDRMLTGNAARDTIVEYAEKHGDLIKLICNKDLDCGVTATTLNKVYGKGFVPQFKVQLATEVAIDKCTLPILGQLKYNGVRVLAKMSKKGVTFQTRSGKFFEYPELADHLLEVCAFEEGYVLDGELTIGDSQGEDHTTVSGIVNSALKGTPIRKKLCFHVFDGMDLVLFNKQYNNDSYELRYKAIKHLVEEIDSPLVYLAETKEFLTHADINEHFEKKLEQGYEGLILKTWRHKYTFKRSKDWVKIKAIKSADLKCYGTVEGKGKYEGQIGALLCRGMVEGEDVIVEVGSGLTDADRALPEVEYLGKFIEAKYNGIIRDKRTGQYSLFLPRFVTVRGDLG